MLKFEFFLLFNVIKKIVPKKICVLKRNKLKILKLFANFSFAPLNINV